MPAKVEPTMPFPLEPASPSSLGLDPRSLDRLLALVRRHIADGRYPAAQLAVARHDKLALFETLGDARLHPARIPARNETLFHVFSGTKVLTACSIWLLADWGALSFHDTVAQHVPGFEAHGKGEITLAQLLSHQAGFPSADVPKEAWSDHELLRRSVCNFTLEWTPGTRLHYHRMSAYWTAAVVVEAVAKMDYRKFFRENIALPLGLGDEIVIGLPDDKHDLASEMHAPDAASGKHVKLPVVNDPDFRRAGKPAEGAFATARGMAAFYQMLAQGGRLNGVRLLSPRTVAYVTRNVTGDRVDVGHQVDAGSGVDRYIAMPIHRCLGPHLRGTTETIKGLGTLASPRTFGQGGVGSSYCWADPDSGVSFAYLTNSKLPDPWNDERREIVSNLVHSSID